jgi:hypothetical protein
VKNLLAGLAVIMVLLAACGGSDDSAVPTPQRGNVPDGEVAALPVPSDPEPDAAGLVVNVAWSAPSLSGNDTNVYGELRSAADTDATDVVIAVTLTDDDGRTISTRDTCVVNDRIQAGANAGFLCAFPLVPVTDVADVSFDLSANPLERGMAEAGGFTSQLRVDGLEWSTENVSGTVTNDGQAEVDDVKIVVVGYAPDGSVSSVLQVGIGQPLAAGASATFSRQMNAATPPLDGGTFPPDRFAAYVSATVAP